MMSWREVGVDILIMLTFVIVLGLVLSWQKSGLHTYVGVWQQNFLFFPVKVFYMGLLKGLWHRYPV